MVHWAPELWPCGLYDHPSSPQRRESELLIILPDHLRVSGITTWAMHAIRGLRERGIPSGLVVHTQPGEEIPDFLAPLVVGHLRNAVSIHRLHGQLDELVEVYLKSIREMYAQTGEPVVVSPNLHGDCYGAVAQISQEHPELIRVASWIHSDNEYDIAVAKRYEPMLHAVVPVSRELLGIANRVLPARRDETHHIPYCVEVPDRVPAREPIDGRPVRIVYTGRLEDHQKRAGVLPLMARILEQRGIEHEFKVVGDGPLIDELRNQSRGLCHIDFVGSVPPSEVRGYLQWADLWVLTSRYEGQSVAMLEALSQGCFPIVTRVRSGAQDAVVEGQTGISVEADWNMPYEEIAERMVDAIAGVPTNELPQYANNAHRLAGERHSVPVHIDAIERLIVCCRSLPDRAWPDSIRASYSAPGTGLDGSTPPDAARRMLELLTSLAGSRVLIYCSGQHTIDVCRAIQAAPVEVVGIIDDDPARKGTSLIGYPIYTSEQIPELDASDVVISSWIYEDTIWGRKDKIESKGVRLHRLYPVETCGTHQLAQGKD